jgi:type I restriction enzyme M protein
VLAPTRQAVLERKSALDGKIQNMDGMLKRAAGRSFYNTSRLDFRESVRDQDNVARNLKAYVAGFSPNAQEIFESYDFAAQLVRLDNAELIYQVASRFTEIDLRPEVVDRSRTRPRGSTSRRAKSSS